MFKAFFVFAAAFLLPNVTSAQGLVPCVGMDCGTCQLVVLANNVIEFIIIILLALLAVLFAVAGFQLVTSGGSENAKQKFKDLAQDIVIGLLIILCSWLIVDTVLKALIANSGVAGNTQFGPWNTIPTSACTQQVLLNDGGTTQFADEWGRLTYIQLNRDVMTPEQVQTVVTNYEQGQGSEWASAICSEAANQGIGQHCSHLTALMIQESGGNPNASSPANAHGLMQILPGTARNLDSSLRGLTDAQIAQKLKDDPQLSIRLGTTYFRQGLEENNGDITSATARYNGGPGALQPSANCPGQQRWQCQWDGEGCINGQGANCVQNQGYKETRHYVTNINNIRQQMITNNQQVPDNQSGAF